MPDSPLEPAPIPGIQTGEWQIPRANISTPDLDLLCLCAMNGVVLANAVFELDDLPDELRDLALNAIGFWAEVFPTLNEEDDDDDDDG